MKRDKSRKIAQILTNENMDPIMKAIKTFRSTIGTADTESVESLEHQRHSQELFSKLITPAVGIDYQKSEIPGTGLWIERACPGFVHRKDIIILYCHGGGYTCGGAGYARILAGKLAMNTGLEAISFDYSLAPENPYPAAIEDALQVWDYLMYMGYGAGNVIVAGDSAGGNMALELVLALEKKERLLPRALILMSPWTDMTATSPAYEIYKDADPLLTKEYVLGVRKAYASGWIEKRREQYPDMTDDELYAAEELSPLYADLSKLPPVLIQVGSNEILRDDSELLAKKLKKSKNRYRLTVYEGGWHVFQQMPISKAAKALEDVYEFLIDEGLL